MTVIFWMFIICKMLKENSWYWFISLVDVQVYWLGLFKSFWSTVTYQKKKRNNFLERKVSNPSVWSCQKNNLLFVVHVSYFSIISSKRWSKNAFLVFVFFFKKLPFSSSSTSRPEKNSAIDGQKKGDVTSPTSSQNSEKHLTEAELKVSIVLSMYITNKLFMLL